jgi:signal transduction histidine kinase
VSNLPVRECVEISVSDTGIGIGKEDQARIFNAFEQVDGSKTRSHEGTGLGLSLTQKLVELHGGKIWIESEGENKGSTFRFIIPIGKEAAATEFSTEKPVLEERRYSSRPH